MAALVIYGALVSFLLLATLWRPPAALAAVLCMFGLEQWAQAQHPFFVHHGVVHNAILGMIVVVAVAGTYLRGRPLVRDYPAVGWAALALFFYALMTIIWGYNRQVAQNIWSINGPYLITFVILAPLLMRDVSDLRFGFLTTLFVGTLILALLLGTTQWTERSIRFVATIYTADRAISAGNPLALAQMAGYLVIIAVLMNFTGLSRFWQIMRWAVVVLAMITLVKSNSRGQFFLMLAAVLMFLPLSRRFRSAKGFFGTIVGIVLLSLIAYWAVEQFGLTRRWSTESMQRDYMGGRIAMAEQLLSFWADSSPLRWLFGLGNSASFDPMLLGIYPHLVPAEVLAEEGIVGFAIYLTFLVLTGRIILRLARVVRDMPVERGVIAVASAITAYELLLTLKQGNLLGGALAFAFPIMLARIEKTMRQEQALLQPAPDPIFGMPVQQAQYIT